MKDGNRSLATALRAPVVMITIGVLFLLDNMTGLTFGRTWPVILIVLGALALAGGGKRPRRNIPAVDSAAQPYPQVPNPRPDAGSYSGARYADSAYAQPPGSPPGSPSGVRPGMRPAPPPPPPGVRR